MLMLVDLDFETKVVRSACKFASQRLPATAYVQTELVLARHRFTNAENQSSSQLACTYICAHLK